MPNNKNATITILKALLIPVFIFVSVVIIFFLYRSGRLGGFALKLKLTKYFYTLILLSGGLIVQSILDSGINWYAQNIAEKTESTLDDEMMPLIKRTGRIVTWIIVLLLILPVYGVNINALIAALGVSSLAIGLAAQDLISNIIAGFMIMIDIPFKTGDKIQLPTGEVVTVFNIGIRRSLFKRDDNAVIIVPNVDLCKSKIVNFTYKQNPKNK
ncbi:MAG: mechanosensitive ion channel [Endomicrobiales bacterium]|nr:mechanosensitive ion channel [Endomicrobiales bacterium]